MYEYIIKKKSSKYEYYSPIGIDYSRNKEYPIQPHKRHHTYNKIIYNQKMFIPKYINYTAVYPYQHYKKQDTSNIIQNSLPCNLTTLHLITRELDGQVSKFSKHVTRRT